MLGISMLFLFGFQNLTAQNISAQRSHALSEQQPLLTENLNATGVLNVVAIMVEFQPDDNRLTSGTGIFGPDGMDGLPYISGTDTRIDPLPHDRNYFEAHLEFAKNYYEKSSDGQLTIDYQVLPGIYRLPKKMEEYSPIGETFTNEKIAELAKDAWQLVEDGADFNASGLDPETTAFIIFHAGVGRDIELTGTNLDITPYDIPSLYLRKEDLGDLLNEPGFDGFPVNDGTFQITNSLILPRTESRRGLDIQDNEFVFPLSINGLLIASIGSHLGLPDLFNTETGDPGIGRFGLMDGAGFFAYNGLLPPEPSAWEKIYLGWETPIIIDKIMTGDISLPASSLNQPNSIAKYKLSDSEYFLIENRHRDPDGTGITVTIRKPDGIEVQQTFTNEDEAFVFQEANFEKLLEAGTFVDASNLDFSLPGGFDNAADRNLNGGILIWHIDEAVINTQLDSDRVNADPKRRGIDLEEADGAQDIGQATPGSLDNSATFGTAYDFWWSGNDYRVILETGREVSLYENRFGTDTYPNNNSNSGAPSFFELYDFSDNQPIATFKIRAIEPNSELYTSGFSIQLDSTKNYFTPDDSYYNYFPLSLSVFEAQNDTFLIVPAQEFVTSVSLSDPVNMQYRLTGTSIQQPLINREDLVLATKPDNSASDINVAALSWNISSFDTVWTATLPANRGFLSSQNGQIIHADFTAAGLNANDGSITSTGPSPLQRSEIIVGDFSEASNSGVVFSSIPNFIFYPESAQNRLYTGSIQLGNRVLFYVFEDARFSLIDPSLDNSSITLFEEDSAGWPAILDDASILRIDKINNQLIGMNKIGGIQNYTPIRAPEGIQFIGTPLYTDLIVPGEEYATLVMGQDNYSLNIYAYREDGTLVNGFPLYVGKSVSADTQPIHPIIYNGTLYALSHKGFLKSWNLTQVSDTKWSSRYGNNDLNKVSARVPDNSDDQSSGFGVLNGAETYNWPNPANDETNIRFQLAPPGGTVEITVITMSGRIIFEETVSTSGGFPQEVRVNTRQWGSGGYVARVKATVEGKSETKLIKIGVVH
ncbi:MAG: T9SS type A sorting domain-containing protein [Gracilimonas sp.]|uniref:T9SS-dependent M6-like inactivated metalloprotease n=1 Tax=Gracilimonas sp. TaxID=1974203 RepID=UPI0019C3C2C1|nr:T9SS type A sorting domain-containing protein [Gracilimonas sp.]MBD3617627.1 T9SS type A sorting domain-containing protein [Gracilimonas sp.]